MFYSKKHENATNKKWNLSKDPFWPRSNIRKIFLQKTLQIGSFLQQSLFILVLKVWERPQIYKKDQTIEGLEQEEKDESKEFKQNWTENFE